MTRYGTGECIQVQLAKGILQRQFDYFHGILFPHLRVANRYLQESMRICPLNPADADESCNPLFRIIPPPDDKMVLVLPLFQFFKQFRIICLDLKYTQRTAHIRLQVADIIQVQRQARLHGGILFNVYRR